MKPNKQHPENYLYINLKGPMANDGRANIGKVGKALVSLDRWTRIYKRNYLKGKSTFEIRVGGIDEGSTEIQIFFDTLSEIINSPVGNISAVGIFTQIPGVKDFLKAYGKILGEHVALKKLAKGKSLRESEPYVKDGKIYVKLSNDESIGTSREVEKKSADFFRESNHTLNNIYVIEPGKEDEIRIGYHSDGAKKDTAIITAADKESFVDYSDPDNLARRMVEPFEEKNATEVKLIGQFIDYHTLAHRYKFSFQARKNQDEHGKQKILCIIEESKISEILDLLKPENKKNVCVSGKATKDLEGKLDKVKIDWFNEDPDYNPDQESLLK